MKLLVMSWVAIALGVFGVGMNYSCGFFQTSLQGIGFFSCGVMAGAGAVGIMVHCAVEKMKEEVR